MKFTIITERLVAADCLVPACLEPPPISLAQPPRPLPLPLPRTNQIDSAAQRSRKKINTASQASDKKGSKKKNEQKESNMQNMHKQTHTHSHTHVLTL